MRRSSPSRSMSCIRFTPERGPIRICRRSCAIRSPIFFAITKTWKPANGSTSRAGPTPRRPPLLLPPQSPAPRVEGWTAQRSRRSIGGLRLAEGTAMAKGILIAAMDFSSVAEDEFNDWYDTEHIPELSRVPGVLCARRFRTAGGSPKYMALYHLASPAVVDGAEWKRASGSTPMPEHIRPQITDRLRLVCRNYRRQG